VFSTLEARKITLTLESGNRIEAETSSNAAAGFCLREATADGLLSREMLAAKINTGADHISRARDVCRALTLIFLYEIAYKTGVCKGKAPTVSGQFYSAARRYVLQGGRRMRDELRAGREPKFNFDARTIGLNGLHAQVQCAGYLCRTAAIANELKNFKFSVTQSL
jgi:hypothetical protein